MSQSEGPFSGDSAVPQPESGLASSALFVTVMPPLFVFLWATGFVFTKLGMPYVEPMTFLVVRFAPVVLLMAAVALATRAPWPSDAAEYLHVAVVGILMHGGYLGGVFMALQLGLPAGIVSLIVGMQPILTAFAVGPLLGERVAPVQWLGVGLGFVGVALVLADKLDFDRAGAAAVAPALVALLGVTFGTLYQKRFCA